MQKHTDSVCFVSGERKDKSHDCESRVIGCHNLSLCTVCCDNRVHVVRMTVKRVCLLYSRSLQE